MEISELDLISSAKADFINTKIKELMVNGLFDEAIAIYPIYNRMVNELISPYDHINGRDERHALKTVNIYMSLLGCDKFKTLSDFENWGEQLIANYIKKTRDSGLNVSEVFISENGRSFKKYMIIK